MISVQRAVLIAGVLALSGGAAAAAPATVSTDLNLRAGPGTQYGVVALLPAGATVDARGCGEGWCQVNFGGYSGYASASYLDPGGVVYAAPPPPPVYVERPFLRPYFGFYGRSYSGGWRHHRHHHHHRRHHRRH